MPLYEYKCQSCQRHTEKRQKFSDPEITECPHCGGHLERVLTAPAVAFKGGGWYKDLYSSAKPPASSSGEAKSEGGAPPAAPAAGGGDSSGASAAKPAAAAAPSAPAKTSSSAPASNT